MSASHVEFDHARNGDYRLRLEDSQTRRDRWHQPVRPRLSIPMRNVESFRQGPEGGFGSGMTVPIR